MPLKVAALTATSVQLDWSAYQGPNSPTSDYEVHRDDVKVATVAAPATTYIDNTVSATATYEYFVRPVAVSESFDTGFDTGFAKV